MFSATERRSLITANQQAIRFLISRCAVRRYRSGRTTAIARQPEPLISVSVATHGELTANDTTKLLPHIVYILYVYLYVFI